MYDYDDEIKKKKEIVLILDGYEQGLEISKRIKDIFSDWEIKEIFWDQEKENFFSIEGTKKNLEPFLLSTNLVVNLLDQDNTKEKLIEVEEILIALKIPRIKNSLKTESLFSSSLGQKIIFENKKIKSPVFEKIFEKNMTEIFQTFPQPAKKHKNFIEEEILGEKIELLIFKDDEKKVFCLNSGVSLEHSNLAKSIFTKLNLERFAIMNFIFSKTRGLYLINIETNLEILLKNDGKNLRKIKKLL